MEIFINNLIIGAEIIVSAIILIHTLLFVMTKMIGKDFINDKDIKEFNSITIKGFYLILLAITIIGLIINVWVTRPWINKQEDIKIKADVPVDFNIPDKQEIQKINSTKTLMEQERKEAQSESEELNRKLVEEALK